MCVILGPWSCSIPRRCVLFSGVTFGCPMSRGQPGSIFGLCASHECEHCPSRISQARHSSPIAQCLNNASLPTATAQLNAITTPHQRKMKYMKNSLKTTYPALAPAMSSSHYQAKSYTFKSHAQASHDTSLLHCPINGKLQTHCMQTKIQNIHYPHLSPVLHP